MKLIPLLLFLTGCAANTDTLIREAKECVASYADDRGVLIDAPQEYKDDCWKEANQRFEFIAKREKQRELEKAEMCPKGTTKWCDYRWDECQCVSNDAVREALRRMRLGQ